jgi:hypothetical protein
MQKQKDSDISTSNGATTATTTTLSTSSATSSAGLSSHNAYLISPHVLKAVFKALVEQKKWKEANELYNYLNTTTTIASLTHSAVAAEAAMVAIVLREENFLRMILKSSNEKYGLPSSIGADFGVYSSKLIALLAEESILNLEERVSCIISQHATLIIWTICQVKWVLV